LVNKSNQKLLKKILGTKGEYFCSWVWGNRPIVPTPQKEFQMHKLENKE
jgi:hypothetical protein